MPKYLFFIICCFFICQNADAQKHDTLTYYFRLKDGKFVSKGDDPTSIIKISPADSSSGKVLYHVTYCDMKRAILLTGNALNNDVKALKLDGGVTSYSANGRKKQTVNHDNGDVMEYYPRANALK